MKRMILSGRSTSRGLGPAKTYHSISFSRWTYSPKDIRSRIDEVLSNPAATFPLPNAQSRQLKVMIRYAISEAEEAEKALQNYRNALEALNRSSFDVTDLNAVSTFLSSDPLSQSAAHKI